jgi:disulfide bond formation protein DsbB
MNYNRIIRKYGLYAVWVIAMVASSITVYLSEVQYWNPCRLCWYQQICMLPLVFIAGIAAWHGFLGIARYLVPQTLIGLGIAITQVVMQIFNPIPSRTPPIEICKPGYLEILSVNCNLNLPILSTIAFFLINVLLFIIIHISKKEDQHERR